MFFISSKIEMNLFEDVAVKKFKLLLNILLLLFIVKFIERFKNEVVVIFDFIELISVEFSLYKNLLLIVLFL
jgi:hypothetical protein